MGGMGRGKGGREDYIGTYDGDGSTSSRAGNPVLARKIGAGPGSEEDVHTRMKRRNEKLSGPS